MANLFWKHCVSRLGKLNVKQAIFIIIYELKHFNRNGFDGFLAVRRPREPRDQKPAIMIWSKFLFFQFVFGF